jgi:hypothetical protein
MFGIMYADYSLYNLSYSVLCALFKARPVIFYIMYVHRLFNIQPIVVRISSTATRHIFMFYQYYLFKGGIPLVQRPVLNYVTVRMCIWTNVHMYSTLSMNISGESGEHRSVREKIGF